MDRLGKLATPADNSAVVCPDSVPPRGFVPVALVMVAVELVTVLANASWTVTCTAGAIATPATAFAGCTVKASLVAAAGLMLNADDVAPASVPEVALSV